MLNCPFFWVDAFTLGPFSGNPAGVCPLDQWPADELLQKIAHQNGLAETAFFVPLSAGRYQLRWFTPSVEIDLCGHATLASAHVIFSELGCDAPAITFETKSGELTVARGSHDRLTLDFPSRPADPITPAALPAGLLTALGLQESDIAWSGRSRDWLIVLSSEDDVRELRPDFNALSKLDTNAVIVSAPGKAVDFVSRFFAPGYGVPEDPVTGSAHCTLIPYWSSRLDRINLTARQLSSRGGQLWCEQRDTRVSIVGTARTYINGRLHLAD